MGLNVVGYQSPKSTLADGLLTSAQSPTNALILSRSIVYMKHCYITTQGVFMKIELDVLAFFGFVALTLLSAWKEHWDQVCDCALIAILLYRIIQLENKNG